MAKPKRLYRAKLVETGDRWHLYYGNQRIGWKLKGTYADLHDAKEASAEFYGTPNPKVVYEKTPKAGGKRRHAPTEDSLYDRLTRIPEGKSRNIGGWTVYNRSGGAFAIYHPTEREAPQHFFYTTGEAARWLLSHPYRRRLASLAAETKALRDALKG